MTRRNIDHIEEFFEEEPRESSSKVDLLSSTHENNEKRNLDNGNNEPGMAKVLVTNLLQAWKHDIFSMLFSLRNALLLSYKTCKVYVLTLVFLGLYIPIFFFLGGILLMVFLLLLGFLPVFGGMLIVPLLISTAVTVSASIGWYVGMHIIDSIRKSPLLAVAANFCYRVKRFYPGILPKLTNVSLHQFKFVSTQQEQFDNCRLDENNSEASSSIKRDDRESQQHAMENIISLHEIQKEITEEPLSFSESLPNLHDDWDHIDGENFSGIYYSFSEIEDELDAIDNGRSHHDFSQLNDSHDVDEPKSECYPDLGIDRIQKLKSSRDILSQMKRNSKPHIFQ